VKPQLTTDVAAMAKVVSRLGQGDPTFAASVKLLDSGDHYLSALERAIQAAKHHVHCEYYIWEPDKVGTRFRDLLVAAVGRGVQVRVVVDAVGSRAANDKFWAPLVAAGGEWVRFNPLRFRLGGLTFANFRTHRKIVVIDGNVGFMGGKNLHDPVSATASGKGAWRDMHTRIDGEPVRRLQRLFVENWIYAGGKFTLDLENVKHMFPAAKEQRGKAVQILASGPDDDRYAIYAFFLVAISTARYRVWITTPYFVPDESLESALRVAVLRGVDVQLIVPLRGDSRVVTAASRTYCDALARPACTCTSTGRRCCTPRPWSWTTRWGSSALPTSTTAASASTSRSPAAFYDKDVIDQLAATFATDRAASRPHKRRKSAKLSAFLDRWRASPRRCSRWACGSCWPCCCSRWRAAAATTRRSASSTRTPRCSPSATASRSAPVRARRIPIRRCWRR
jgi:cardiolipin synthase